MIFEKRWNRYIEVVSKSSIKFTESQLLALLDKWFEEKIQGMKCVKPSKAEQEYIEKVIDLFNFFLASLCIMPLDFPVSNVQIVDSLSNLSDMRCFKVKGKQSVTIFDHIIISRSSRHIFIDSLVRELARIFGGYLFIIHPSQADADISLDNIKFWRGICSYNFLNEQEEFTILNDGIVDFFSAIILEKILNEFDLNKEEKDFFSKSINSLPSELIKSLLIRSPHRNQITQHELHMYLIQNYVLGRIKKLFTSFNLTHNEIEELRILRPLDLNTMIEKIKAR